VYPTSVRYALCRRSAPGRERDFPPTGKHLHHNRGESRSYLFGNARDDGRLGSFPTAISTSPSCRSFPPPLHLLRPNGLRHTAKPRHCIYLTPFLSQENQTARWCDELLPVAAMWVLAFYLRSLQAPHAGGRHRLRASRCAGATWLHHFHTSSLGYNKITGYCVDPPCCFLSPSRHDCLQFVPTSHLFVFLTYFLRLRLYLRLFASNIF
jgi:hypothetical protein